MDKKKFEYVNEAAHSAMLDLPEDVRIEPGGDGECHAGYKLPIKGLTR